MAPAWDSWQFHPPINPMGKVPAIKHGSSGSDRMPRRDLHLSGRMLFRKPAGRLPRLDRADYYRWMFFAAGPVGDPPSAIRRWAGGKPRPNGKLMMGYGSFCSRLSPRSKLRSQARLIRPYTPSSAADAFLGSVLDFMINFKLLEPSAYLTNYLGPLRERAAYKRAKEIDAALSLTNKAGAFASSRGRRLR